MIARKPEQRQVKIWASVESFSFRQVMVTAGKRGPL